MDNLSSLIARVEGLDGPCRQTDANICIALGLSRDNGIAAVNGWCIGSATNPKPYRSPAYTASIDAAMTLVPEGWKFGIEQPGVYDGKQVAEAWCWPFDSSFDPDWRNGQQGYREAPDGFRGYADTAALALCAAALRARLNTEPRGDVG